MYRVFECLATVAGVGLIGLATRISSKVRRGGLSLPAARFALAAGGYVLFCSALAYYAIVVYLTRGTSTALGWYLYAIAGAEVVLLAAGFTGLAGTHRAAGCIAAVAALACTFDLYTVNFVSLPYYTGLTAHLSSGFVAAFHPAATLRHVGAGGVFARLAVNKPAAMAPSILAILWMAYLCASLGLLAYSTRFIRRAFFSNRPIHPFPMEFPIATGSTANEREF
jgi:hypothetical protein